MSKIIITNYSDLSDSMALQLVDNVINGGRICNEGKRYCYVSVFTLRGIKYQVDSYLRKSSDSFVVLGSKTTTPEEVNKRLNQ